MWLSAANQTGFATLAPTVFEHRNHPFAARLLDEAGRELADRESLAAIGRSAFSTWRFHVTSKLLSEVAGVTVEIVAPDGSVTTYEDEVGAAD